MSYLGDYEDKRAKLAAEHDEGAEDALRFAAELDVDCGSYCYGGSARLDVPETLAELAETGWRLMRVEVATA